MSGRSNVIFWLERRGLRATEAVVDREHDHYELLHVGWDGPRRVHGSVFHIDIRDGKIWVQYDGTDRPVAEELLDMRNALVAGPLEVFYP